MRPHPNSLYARNRETRRLAISSPTTSKHNVKTRSRNPPSLHLPQHQVQKYIIIYHAFRCQEEEGRQPKGRSFLSSLGDVHKGFQIYHSNESDYREEYICRQCYASIREEEEIGRRGGARITSERDNQQTCQTSSTTQNNRSRDSTEANLVAILSNIN